jgi:hypothetical protein
VPEGAEQASGDLIDCEHCGKSFAPTTYEKICKQFNKDGERKCVAMYKKKRKVRRGRGAKAERTPSPERAHTYTLPPF